MAGETVDMGWFRDWLETIRQWTAEGRRITRVRIVTLPLTDYSRFGVFCSEHTNAAGEDIRYLPREEADELPDQDFWLFDSSMLVRQHYDDEDAFLGGEIVTDPAAIIQACYWRDAAWHHARLRETFADV